MSLTARNKPKLELADLRGETKLPINEAGLLHGECDFGWLNIPPEFRVCLMFGEDARTVGLPSVPDRRCSPARLQFMHANPICFCNYVAPNGVVGGRVWPFPIISLPPKLR